MGLLNLQSIPLGDDGGCEVIRGSLPENTIPGPDQFEELWDLHPDHFSEAVIHGRVVKMPRWVQAYEKNYAYSNQLAVAKKAPPVLMKFLEWCQSEIDQRSNGILVNWHDGKLRHCHGKHRDEVKGLVPGAPIVTISLGEERVFRLRPYPEGKPKQDIVLQNGEFIVIPWETNQKWTHEVPRFARYQGRRISVTMRAFR